MKKSIIWGLLMLAVWAYILMHTDNRYKDRLLAYEQWFHMVQQIGSSDTVDYNTLASWLQNIITIDKSWYKPYEFAALFLSTLNKLNTTISTGNINKLTTIAEMWLQIDCDQVVLQKIFDTAPTNLSWLTMSDPICQHHQLPRLLAITYSSYKKNERHAQQLYFIADHSADADK